MPNDITSQKTTLSAESIPAGISSAQAIALGSLLAGRSKTTAARDAGVSRSTVHKWTVEDPDFMAAYNSMRLEMVQAIEQNLKLLSTKALVVLRRLLTRRSVPDSIKLQAAVAVIKLGLMPVSGPIEPEDAANSIFHAAKQRERESMLAPLGLKRKDLIAQLKRTKVREEEDDSHPVGAGVTGLPSYPYDPDEEEIDEEEIDDEEEDDDDLEDEDDLDDPDETH
jgi:hypothetical protein